MDDRHARAIASNEAMFRQINEIVQDAAEQRDAGGEILFLCECGDDACAESVAMTQEEYERIRGRPTHFFVRPGHAVADVENVIDRKDTYWVVEKVGAGATVAEDTYPRP